MYLNETITDELIGHGVNFVHFVDISHLSDKQNRGLPNAILFGIVLSPAYIKAVTDTPDYVKARVENNYDFDDDEYLRTELKTGELSDYIAGYLTESGYNAYSQSDENQIKTAEFDGVYGKTFLPHKTIAVLGGIGWIGKNNLLVTHEYGSGLCLGAILTDAPLNIVKRKPLGSECSACTVCKDICEANALKGHMWNTATLREDMIDVDGCTTCIKCLMHCPWTQRYSRQKMK
jgi:epoxyqueuosine reductase QueG